MTKIIPFPNHKREAKEELTYTETVEVMGETINSLELLYQRGVRCRPLRVYEAFKIKRLADKSQCKAR